MEKKDALERDELDAILVWAYLVAAAYLGALLFW